MKDERRWIEKICEVVVEQSKATPYRSQRAVLVICESIKQAKILFQAFGDKIPNKTLYINNNMDNSAIFSKKLGAGDVIIATNLAGRGTDLQISASVKAAGGLFVLQTFLPKNARVEAQAFGRAARQGSPGSAQLIVCSSHLSELLQLLILREELLALIKNITHVCSKDLFVRYMRVYQQSHTKEFGKKISSILTHILQDNPKSDMSIVKGIRDSSVAKQLSSYVENHLPKIKKKEELFNQYLETLDFLYKNNNNKPAESDVSALNEFWGMWLLTKFDETDSIDTLKCNLRRDLDEALQELTQKQSPLSNLYQYTAYGSELRNLGRLSESVDMYTKAINQDSCWAAIAYYNRAFAALSQQKKHPDPKCLSRALEDLQKAFKSVNLHLEQLDVTYRYTTDLTSNLANRYDKHTMARHTVLVSFKANIYEAIQKLEKAKDKGGSVKVEDNLVYFLVSLKHCLPLSVLLTESVSDIFSKDPLIFRQLLSHPSFDVLLELMSFKTMGLTHVYVIDGRISLSGIISKIDRTLH